MGSLSKWWMFLYSLLLFLILWNDVRVSRVHVRDCTCVCSGGSAALGLIHGAYTECVVLRTIFKCIGLVHSLPVRCECVCVCAHKCHRNRVWMRENRYISYFIIVYIFFFNVVCIFLLQILLFFSHLPFLVIQQCIECKSCPLTQLLNCITN